jgi:alcohol-forming fatty acyl-CoA reductase
LLRPKRGKTIEERMQKLLNLPLFEPLRNYNPKLLEKIVPIAGDVTKIGLGISNSDFMKLERVSIIFHSAASVRFDDTLKYAMMMNTRGTREIITFAKTLRDLKVLMYVSTTYSHPELKDVGEVIHEPYVDWKDSIKVCEKIDPEILDILTPKYTHFMPNTYTFTKSLAEQIIADHQNDIPMVLFRPSIVISSMKEPFPGWIDNFNGPVGLLVGSGLGITRTMFCDPDNIADFTPVDICIKAMIISAYKRALDDRVVLPIYNCCTSNYRCATLGQIIDIGRLISYEIPLDQGVWAPGGRLTSSRMLNYIKVLFVHFLPALLIDVLIKIRGLKPL